MTLEQTSEVVVKIQEVWDALAQSIAKMWEEIFSAPDMWPGQKSIPPKKYGMSLLKKRPNPSVHYRYIPCTPRNLPYQRRSY